MQRSPLGGRGFESFSEDPVLAGNMSAATIDGIQSLRVAATLKHYVCNDQEHERQSVNAIVSERALREIYLSPFQIAERDSKPMCIMTSYNKVNGMHASHSKRLIQDILRRDWGFKGLVMSDWFGSYSTTEAIKAGLDLEMPGPTYVRCQLVKHALGCGGLRVAEHLTKPRPPPSSVRMRRLQHNVAEAQQLYSHTTQSHLSKVSATMFQTQSTSSAPLAGRSSHSCTIW